MKSNPLFDLNFLKKLDQFHHKVIFAKIISLNRDEEPLESIEGQVKAGTINIDGSSAIRRSCKLTLVSNEVNINDFYWGLTNKFKLEIGLLNIIDPKYPDIIWFPQGVFVITTFNVSYDTKQYTISIQGQDKMCLLNGTVGGNFPMAIDFAHQQIQQEDDSILEEDIPIPTIIREMIHKYGNEPLYNIVINDVDDVGLEQLDYIGTSTIYLFRTIMGDYTNLVFEGNETRYERYTNQQIKINDSSKMIYYSLASNADNSYATWLKSSPLDSDDKSYQVVKCLPGEAAGYRMTPLIWPEKEGLIANVGETVTSVLDKICKQFGEYEYFYNIDGQFVFQKKLTYVNTSWNNIITIDDDETYIESSKLVSQIMYNFSNNILISSFQNNPDLKKIRNDFAIWGKRKENNSSSSSSNSVKEGNINGIHMRYAIQEKPKVYTDYNGTTWTAGKLTLENVIQKDYSTIDWRELIYLMAQDYLQHNHDDDFLITIARNNPEYRFGRTGYEQYYEDILQFWRELYNPYTDDEENYYVGNVSGFGLTNYGWNKMIFDDPSNLRFWFDFLDSIDGELAKYSVNAIGDRPKTINEDSIKTIIYKEIPSLIYISSEKYNELKSKNGLLSGYNYIQLPTTLEEYFQKSTQSKTAQQVLDNLLYTDIWANEKVTLKALPIYYLNPNTKIMISDNYSKINGEYILDKISLNLDNKGNMSITASKAPIRLY